MNRRFANLVVFLLVLPVWIGFAGCMVGPDYSRPETAADNAESFTYAGEHITDANAVETVDTWWKRFGDPVTADLVRQALQNNYDLKAAAARLLQAQALLVEAHGAQMPQISYNLSRSRSKMSLNFGGAGRFSVLNTTFNQQFSVSYIVDFFGKLKRTERAAWAEMLASKAAEKALINSIIAAVINSRVNIATIQRQLEINDADIENRRKNLEIVERRYRHGLVGPVDVRLARENLEAARAVRPAVELSLIKAHNALDILLGRRPGSTEPLPQTLADLPDLEPVPVGIPACLLDRRPDVIAAEMSLKASNERIGVSIARLYPDLTLSGGLGRSADRWRDIWLNETEIYSAAFSLTQPIFNAGQIRAQIDFAKARNFELAANYANVVLKAFREVEDTLISEELLQVRMKHTLLMLEQAGAAENLSRQRYQRGVETILAVLESERRRRIAETELNVLKGQIWTNRVNLFLALGGDWSFEETIPG